MNKKNRILLVAGTLGAVALAVALAIGQSGNSTPAAAKSKPKKVVLVKTLTTPQQVQEFEQNVALVQNQRQIVVELKAAIDKETDAAKKKDLQAKLDEVWKKLNENNEAMTKAYGFSLTRNYTLQFTGANIYMEVSDEEAAKIEAQQKAQAAKK